MRRFMRRNRWMGLLASFFILLALLSPAAAGQEIPDVQNSAGEEVFERLDGSTFYFLSGAGAWSTELVVSPDGSFTGYYHDTDMGDSGADYPASAAGLQQMAEKAFTLWQASAAKTA